MAITSNGLQQLGFESSVDFELQDNSDGQGTFIANWMSAQPQPSEAEIESAHNEWKAEYDAQEYARNRKAEYPSINDLIVALWENVVEERAASVISLEATRQAIKAKYPK
jgi:hypothetical protein